MSDESGQVQFTIWFNCRESYVEATRDGVTLWETDFSPIRILDFDDQIVTFLRTKHNLLIGEPTAEWVLMRAASAKSLKKETTISVSGRNLTTGLPTKIEISSDEITKSILSTLDSLGRYVRMRLDPPPLPGVHDRKYPDFMKFLPNELREILRKSSIRLKSDPCPHQNHYPPDSHYINLIRGLEAYLSELIGYEVILAEPEQTR